MNRALKGPFITPAGSRRGVLFLAVFFLCLRAPAVDVLMQHNDLSRTGANIQETILTPANVNAANFGELFSNPVDDQVYAQPLYVENLRINGGIHDVVFVCTETNSVFAFDADTAGITYWQTNLGAPYQPGCDDLIPNVGITGTPVIDLASGTMYLDTALAAGPAHKLHALDITTGAEKFGGPVTIAADSFDASIQRNREGLLLLNGVVYLAYASYCDGGDYHGFVLGYDATNLTPLYSFNTTPTGALGGVWSGGMAPAVDAGGNIYIMVGNGDFDGINNFGECMVKLSPSLTVEDFATPVNWADLNNGDADMGSGGPVLLPPHYVVGVGKVGILYLADVNNMGQVDNFVQQLNIASDGNTVGPSPVYWEGPAGKLLFVLHSNNQTQSFLYTGSNFITTPLGTADFSFGDRVGGESLSASGTTNGVLWEIGDDSNLRAYDAANFPALLWTGSIGTYVKMTCPTIANGRVYVGTGSSLCVFGLTNFIYTQRGVAHPVLTWAAGTLEESASVTGPWTTNAAASPYTVTPTNAHRFYRVLMP